MRILQSLTTALLLSACAVLGAREAGPRQAGPVVLMASTIGPIDAGIVEALEAGFERDTGIRVRHVGAGTGAALDIGRQGNVDLVLVHARALEERFVAEGFGLERIPLMYNDFVLVGPPSDPAGVRGMKGALEALRVLAAKGAPFVTRGDLSGTHVAERDLWTLAGIKPEGPWYRKFERGAEGNVATLLFTGQQGAYTLIDRATYLGARSRVALDVLVEGDEVLLNHISVILVNPARFPRVDHAAAKAFAAWLTDPAKGQAVIAAFGKDRFGQPLFFPESRAWKAAAAGSR
ncbi:substrate-binding domain-containing protein [Mesoterricola sediminis]|uniref:Tungsten ABC transporter substrate-binding protein n=1 Tax=Mesoterricola sediminis TaxID=2927980 RepID=A0AA48GQE6_9BACT|nr:substrate-binding domain-containing protein [Mesoterricola sediminis]BDU75672.1 tungsten ABC transporter substrate-binding protein [Mesoterricola sediminis]